MPLDDRPPRPGPCRGGSRNTRSSCETRPAVTWSGGEAQEQTATHRALTRVDCDAIEPGRGERAASRHRPNVGR